MIKYITIIQTLENKIKFKCQHYNFYASFESTYFRSPNLTRALSADVADWNPFDDNFGPDTEEEIFGKEFDKLRRGSNSSKF